MSTNSQVLMKYRKFARYVGWTVQVFYVLSIVASLCLSVAGCIMLFVPGSSFDFTAGDMPMSFTLDGMLSFRFELDQAEAVNLKSLIVTGAFLASATSAGIALFWRQIRLILRTVQEDRPFAKENARRLTVVGGLLLAGSILVRVELYILAGLLVDTLKLENVHPSFNVEPVMFMSGFLILILAGVFHHGSLLQEEFDATV